MKQTFDVIYADPPWKYGSGGARGGQFASVDYPCMTLDELKAIPVSGIAESNAALFLWATSPFMPAAIELGLAWGFNYVRIDKVWAKRTAKGNRHGVVGPWGMTDVEFLLLFVRGRMHAQQRDRAQWTLQEGPEVQSVAYPGRHSAKPAVFREQIEKRFPDARYLEMFARTATRNWQVWGNEAPGSLDLFHSDLL